MGKNKNKKNNMTCAYNIVSIVTITQYSRWKCLQILDKIIENQTWYDSILEWVIVEGSKTEEMAKKNEEQILHSSLQNKEKIKYIPFQPNSALGKLRNRGNEHCQGEIIVCMDDDDYYFPTRIEHVVKKLQSSSCLIAGCSALFMYDFVLKKMYQFKGFGPNHSTNNCMAYKKEYIINHRYEDDKECGEEKYYTNSFSEPMIQLDPYHTIIGMSHLQNTFNKRELLIGGSLKINPTLEERPSMNIRQVIPHDLFASYLELFDIDDGIPVPYDIIYFTGGFGIPWSPYDQSLGGSEQAIVQLSQHWKQAGKRVAVYALLSADVILSEKEKKIQVNGVDYYPWKEFPFHKDLSSIRVILWRMNGMMCSLPFGIKTNHIYIDLHDKIHDQFVVLWNSFRSRTQKIFLKSQFHLELFQKELMKKNINPLLPHEYSVVMNGIPTELFLYDEKSYGTRNPYRFCYTSCYTRGLAPLLLYVWPIVFKHEPRCELHVYYGMNNINENDMNQKQFKQNMQFLLSSPGVMDHGRQSRSIILREKHLSTFQLYITSCEGEIDCIAIRESLCVGCIPLLSDQALFKEREGIHFELPNQEQKTFEKIALDILRLLRDPDRVENKRQEYLSSKPLSWKEVAFNWLEIMEI